MESPLEASCPMGFAADFDMSGFTRRMYIVIVYSWYEVPLKTWYVA